LREEVYRFLKRVGRVVDITWGESFSVTWGSVTLPASMSEDLDLMLRHAERLLTYFPANPETVAVAKTIGLSRGMNPDLFAAFSSDLIVAHSILKEGRDSERYLRVIRHIAEQYSPPLAVLLTSFGYMMTRRVSVIDSTTSAIVSRLKDILEYGLPMTRKLEAIADVLAKLIPDSPSESPRRPGDEGGDELHKALALAELSPETLEEAIDRAGGYSAGPDDEIRFEKGPISSAMKMRLLSRVQEVRPKGRSGGERFYEHWVIGDDPQRLLIRETLLVFGTVLPPIASLKLGGTESEPARGGGEALIVMDVSSSMKGMPAYYCRLAAAAILTVSADMGMDVSICFFNGTNLLKRYGRSYDEALDDISSVVFEGNTRLGDALEVCLNSEYTSVHVITDADIDEQPERERILHLLSTIKSRAELTVYALLRRGQDSWLNGDYVERVYMGEEFTERPFTRHQKLYQ